MDPPDPSQSPGRNFFDPSSLLGSSPFSPTASAANPYAHLAHMPSAFSLLGRHPGFPGAPPFGGLGSLSDPLRSPGSMLSPTTGGAEWWRAASDHVRCTAGFGDVDYLAGSLPPHFGPPPGHVSSSGENGSIYRPGEDSSPKYLNGAYSSLFGLPTYTTASVSSSSTKSLSSTSREKQSSSSTSSSTHKSSSSSKTDAQTSSSSSSSHSKRASSPPSSSTHSLSSVHNKDSSSYNSLSDKSARHTDSHGHNCDTSNSPKTKNGPGTSAVSSYDEEVAKSLSSIFSFPDTSAMLAPSMFAAPPLFTYPYGAGALFAAHHASLFGGSMAPGHLAMPYPMAASPPAGSPHSTHSSSKKSSSSAVTKTTVATATTPSVIPASASASGSTPGKASSSDPEPKSRKSLFNEHSAKNTSSSSSARTSALKKRKQSSPKHKRRGVSSDSDSIPDVSSDSLSDDSDLENDSPDKAKHKKMPKLAPVSQSHPKPDSSEWSAPDLGARPPTPDLVQDLSMKKRRPSDSSHTSASSVNTSASTSNKKKESHNHTSSNHKSSSSSSAPTSSSAYTSSSSPAMLSPAISSPMTFPMSMPMHSSFADMTAQHMESLFGAGHLPPNLPMFFHPAAAMMAPMLDSSMSMSLLLPPPPSSAQAAASSRSRGRGRGRGSRGNRSSSATTGPALAGSADKSLRGRGRPGRPRGSKSRGRSSSSLDYAALSRLQVSKMYEQMYSQQLQEEQHQAALREHMELQLKAHQQMAAIHMSQDPHQMAMQLAKESSNEATNKLHQLADAHAAASRKSDEKTKSQSSKLSNALMGQPVALSGKSPMSTSSYAASKHSEATSDSDGEDDDSILDGDTSGTSGSDSDSDDTDMGAQSSQDSETASYTTQGSKRPGDESDSTTPRKKRRRIHEIDETEIRIPLEHGWRRQTRLRGIGSRGLIGEVVYFAPCGKKLKTVPDVARYLEKNTITDLTRSNFTFSTKVNVGDFLEAQSEDANSGYVALTEEEVVERFMLVAQRKRAKLIAKQERAERRRLRKQQAAEMAQRMAEAKVAKRMEQQEMARRISEMKMRRKMERQQARENARREKQMRAMEMKKMKDQEKMMRQQEKVQRQEQMRIEREVRAQQIMEEKQRRKDQLQRRMYEDALQKAKDREMKRQQAVMMKEQAGPAVQTLSLDGSLFGSPSPAPASARGLAEASLANATRPASVSALVDGPHPLSTSSHWSSGSGSTNTFTSSANSTSATTYSTTPALRLPNVTGSEDRITSTLNRGSSAGVGQYGPYTELLYQSVVSHAAQQERERRKQMMVMASLERERRRQHMLLVKALEARKRHEDREKAKEDKRNEKIMERDRKMEQRKLEMEIAGELRKPVEDMLVNNHQEMPKVDRIPGVCLAGKAFADTIMVVEFLNNFGTALGFDDESLPTIQELQSALLGDEDDVDELVTVITHLLKFAITDPGFPSQKEAVTPSGLKISDLEVTEENMSEILRIFVRARNSKDDEMTDWLLDKPLLALTPTQKAACLAFLCNELLSSKSIYGEIEKSIDGLSNLRRDKWMSEGKVRKYRMMQARKLRAQTNAVEAGSEAASKKGSEDEDEGDKDKDEDDDDSDNDSDVTNATGNVSDEEEDLNLEEIEKKIEKINKQQSVYNRKVNDCTNRLRAQDLGQDRYKRRFWVLPHAGGVFVEAMESAETDPDTDTDSDEEEKKEEKEESEKPEAIEQKVKVEQEKEKENDTKENGDISLREEKAQVEKMDEEKETVKQEAEQNDKEKNAEIPKEELEEKCNAKETLMEVDEKIPPTKMMNGVKKEHEGDSDILYDSIQKKLERIQKDRVEKETGDSCVKVEMNGKRTDEAMVLENGDIKEDHGLILNLKRSPEIPAGDKLKDTESIKEEKEMDGIDLSQKDKCIVNGSSEDKCSAFKVPSTSASSLLLAKAEGNAKLGDVLGTPPTFLTPPSSFSTPPPSSLDIFKTAQNKYSIPNSHTEIASSFRSIDTILGSPDHKSTPRSSSSPLFNSSFLSPQNVLSSTPVSAEQMLKDLSQRSLQDTWFSILPKMPCDEASITRCTSSFSSSTCHSGAIYSTANSTGTPLSTSQSNPNLASLRNSPVDFNTLSQTSSILDKLNLSGINLNLSRNEDGNINLAELGIRDNCLHKEAKRIPQDKRHGWWKITSTEQLQAVMKCLHSRGIRERCLKSGIEKYYETAGADAAKDFQKDLITLEETDLYKEIVKTPLGAPQSDSRCGWSEPECQKAEAAALEEVEALEERVFGASLQVKGCTLKSKVSEDDEKEEKKPKAEEKKPEPMDDDREPIEIAREKLLQLEKNIERRYLKPPLAKGVQINLANLSGNTSMPHDDSDADDDEDDVPVPLMKWREAVSTAVSAAQMHLCVFQLNKCIAWEKSIMKVSCQICRKDDNEAELLLCDSCDKGYHTYCFKPKMEDIPEGDWYCYACISKATGEPTCVVCGRKGPKIASCEGCTHAIHIECMDPPLPRLPRRYACHTCSSTKTKGRRNRKPPPKTPPPKETKGADKSIEKSESDTSQHEQPTPEKENKKETKKETKEKEKKEEKSKAKEKEKKEEKEREKEEKKEKEREKEKEKEEKKEPSPKKNEKKGEKKKAEKPTLRESSRNADKTDLTPCRTLLAELERHEEAWPFIEPVNTKQFPSYKKVIKHPMDLQAMKHKLRDNVYKLRDEFATDARQMFNNCQVFNEDESEVGQAGFILRSFFEKRWKELGCS